jgi:hypothetical protein
MRPLAPIAVIVLRAGVASAQTDAVAQSAEIATDNPGLTQTTEATKVGSLITEQSVELAFPEEATVLEAPKLLGRFGVVSWLELRAQLPSAVVQLPEQGNTRVDANDFELGVAAAGKLSADWSGSLVPNLIVPAGDAPPAAEDVEGWIQGNLDWSLSSNVSLGVGAQAGWQQQAADGDTQAQFSLMGGALLKLNASKTVWVFVQNYYEYVSEENVEPVVGGGGAWSIAPRTLLFAEANSGVSEDSPPLSVNAGSAVQWW